MGETSTTAMLVGTRDMFAARSPAVTATLSRDEIEAALSMDPPADLILEVLRPSEAAGEKHSVYVTWERSALESVLRDPGGDAITFSFDPAELERALDAPDVEGHGLRETAVVLSIAAAAVVGVSNASAEPGGAVYSPNQVTVSGHDEATLAARGIEPGTLAAVHDEATLTARGVEPGTLAATSVHDEATLTARGVEPGTLAATSVHDEATLTARGVEPATLAAVHDEATLTARGVEPGTLAATSVHDEATLTARGVEPATLAAVHDEATLTARGVEPGTLAAVHDEATLTARGVEPGTLAATSVHDEATLTARGVEPTTLAAASSGHDEATLTARGVEPATLAAVHDEATLTARGVEPASPQVVSDTGGGFELPSVDSGTVAGIAGGLAGAGLLIAAAAFATTRRRDPEQFA